MKNKHKSNKTKESCDEFNQEDGIDPKILFRKGGRKQNHLKKDRQLCKQAFQLLSLAMDKYSATEWGEGMFIANITPDPDATRLKVTIGFYLPRTYEQALETLVQLRGLIRILRRELAVGISRKKVPDLIFDIAPAGDVSW